MKISLNTVKTYTTVDMPTDQLVTMINAQLGGVEEVIDLNIRYKDALIVKIVSAQPHPNADRLSVCMIDDGGVSNVTRDENNHVQVVCGAPNAREGIYAVWLPPGATVPSSFNEKTPFVLDARELRGVMSHGMLAASDELAFGSDHSGIVEIDPNEHMLTGVEIAPGVSFSKAYGLDDTIIDIENKMFTHRPDLFGQLGVAREIAGIQHQAFTDPEWYWNVPEFESGNGLEVTVRNDAPDHVPRLMTVALKDVEIKPSPLWLQAELVRLGSKPINNVVDATNYLMLLTAQPVHAYDYDKLRGHTLVSRLAHRGETVTLLNGKTYELDESDIVIADAEGPIGLAGIMGGNNSEVSTDTRNILLEVANFDMYTVRKSSMRHGIFTDALTRFNKGQSPLQNDRVLTQLLTLLQQITPGAQASDVVDHHHLGEVYDTQSLSGTLTIETSFINERLGLHLSEDEIGDLLRNVHFSCHTEHEGVISVTAPFWRTDIQLPEDIVEEVGRLYGFDKLPKELPSRTMVPTKRNASRDLKDKIRKSLSRVGANEVLTYSFVHESVMRKAQQDISQAFELGNALSPDLRYYRLSVLPSLLDKVHSNIKSGHDEFLLFEIGKGHNKTHHANDDNGLPRELEFVDAVYAAKKPRDGAAYYQLKRIIDDLAEELGVWFVYKSITEPLDFPVTAPFDQSRSALIETNDGVFIGMVGELQASVIRDFKLPPYSAAMTLDTAGLLKAVTTKGDRYRPLSRYPSVTQDISLKTDSTMQHAVIKEVVTSALQDQLSKDEYNWSVSTISIYSPDTNEYKTTTFRLIVSSYEKTLIDSEVTQLLDKVASEAAQKIDAVRV